jgi:hypothetical protein
MLILSPTAILPWAKLVQGKVSHSETILGSKFLEVLESYESRGYGSGSLGTLGWRCELGQVDVEFFAERKALGYCFMLENSYKEKETSDLQCQCHLPCSCLHHLN